MRYTVWLEKHELNEDDDVIGRELTAPEAAKIIREYGGAKPRFEDADYSDFRSLEMIHFHSEKMYRSVIAATVPKTVDLGADRRAAMSMIDEQIVRRHRELWPGRVSTDAEFDARLAHVEERRAVQALDREITTKLIDALIKDGYMITCCIRDREPTFKRSVDRDGILGLLFDLDLAELHVEKNGERSWIMLIFGEAGWDVVADHSLDLEGLIETIVDQYLPGNNDDGITVLTLPSPKPDSSEVR